MRKALSVIEFSESDIEVTFNSTLTLWNSFTILSHGDFSILPPSLPPRVLVAFVWNHRERAASGKRQVRRRRRRVRDAQQQQQQRDALGVKGEEGTSSSRHILAENRKRSGVCISSIPLQLLGVPTEVLHQGLTHRKIEAKTEEVTRVWITSSV